MLVELITKRGTRKNVPAVEKLLDRDNTLPVKKRLPKTVRKKLETFVEAKQQGRDSINPDSGKKSVPQELRQQPLTRSPQRRTTTAV
ncbi:hypothetical protein COT30_03260 [Candidatus Micrarchaeota archaeon CG08_land_8_20_14_0_20_49_17]|nr:MAG: hypothetical protein AUJ13_05800 [Candidatus Micrarchaeota archaeon CG1_02_49_24]PIU09673.1 MAG: hypothetical protein COT30_03260 [Candidatus Micrarchaeota archaeon CG08_land_8_20_14_0_20_49_17]HII53984.1 hypothetical protein [Candidatus Micrarchaeota archaeon]